MDTIIMLIVGAVAAYVGYKAYTTTESVKDILKSLVDRNKDGSVNTADAVAVAAKAKGALDAALDKAKSIADANEDGKISFDDLKAAIFGIKEELTPAAPEDVAEEPVKEDESTNA